MIEHRALKHTRFACAFIVLALTATPAFAVNKDMVQLQTQVQDLQTAVAHLQQSNDERMGVLRDLVQQNADSVNKMSGAVEALQKLMLKQEETSGAKLDQVSGQMQSLNDSLDEVKARMNSLEKALASVQNQQQSINATLQNMAPPAGSAPTPGTGGAPSDQPAAQPPMANPGRASSDIPPFPQTQGPPQGPLANTSSAAGAPPVATMYNGALKDYMAAKYALAETEFEQVTSTYPSESLAGNSYYYMGEIDYRLGKYAAAVKDYDQVLSQYPSNPKIPVSHLHKGQALLQMKQRDACIEEFRALIQRFPSSPEATQAQMPS